MSKYFDRLVQINESLDKELGNEPETVSAKNNLEAAIKTYSKYGLSDEDCILKAFYNFLYNNPNTQNRSMDDISLPEFCGWLLADPNDTELYLEGDDDDSISIPKDSLTDDQKKDILKDNGVDAATVDGMKTPEELDSAMDATLNNDELKKESSDGEVIVQIVDEDLGIDGFVSEFDGRIVDITPNEGEAKVYASEEIANIAIGDMCVYCHYDPESFTIIPSDGGSFEDDEEWTTLEDPNMSI